jgi:hypothetical protein
MRYEGLWSSDSLAVKRLPPPPPTLPARADFQLHFIGPKVELKPSSLTNHYLQGLAWCVEGRSKLFARSIGCYIECCCRLSVKSLCLAVQNPLELQCQIGRASLNLSLGSLVPSASSKYVARFVLQPRSATLLDELEEQANLEFLGNRIPNSIKRTGLFQVFNLALLKGRCFLSWTYPSISLS